MHMQHQENAELDKVAELVGEIKFAMMATEEADGTLRSRPMATLEMDAQGNLWFFTALSSQKIEEAAQHRQVNLAYARPDRQDYLSISATASFVQDKEKMRALWTPWIKPWFPNGLDDPDLVLLKVSITEAEYWVAPGSTVKRLYGLAKGVMTGNADALGNHRKVVM